MTENGHHRFIYLSAWSSVVRDVWEGLGGTVLLGKVCLCGGL